MGSHILHHRTEVREEVMKNGENTGVDRRSGDFVEGGTVRRSDVEVTRSSDGGKIDPTGPRPQRLASRAGEWSIFPE